MTPRSGPPLRPTPYALRRRAAPRPTPRSGPPPLPTRSLGDQLIAGGFRQRAIVVTWPAAHDRGAHVIDRVRIELDGSIALFPDRAGRLHVLGQHASAAKLTCQDAGDQTQGPDQTRGERLSNPQ